MGWRSREMAQDRSKLAKLCTRFVKNLFSCPDSTPTSDPTKAVPSLYSFISYALRRTQLHNDVCMTALMLLQKLKDRFPSAQGSSGSRLFLSAYMIAQKVICDDIYSNKSWAIVGQGLFSLREINQMERELCGYLDWQLNIEEDALELFRERVCQEFLDSTNCDASDCPQSSETPAPGKPTTPAENDAPQDTRSGSTIGRCIDTALRCIGIRPRGDSTDPETSQPHGASSEPSRARWKRPKRRRPNTERPRSNANIYGGSFTNVEGDVNPVTNIYVSVQSTQSVDSDPRPDYMPPRTRARCQPSYSPNVSPPMPAPASPPASTPPQPQVGYSPPVMAPYPFVPVAFPILYPVYPFPSAFYGPGITFMSYCSSFSFVLAGWLRVPSYWRPGFHWG